jgi:hypothetical protein
LAKPFHRNRAPLRSSYRSGLPAFFILGVALASLLLFLQRDRIGAWPIIIFASLGFFWKMNPRCSSRCALSLLSKSAAIYPVLERNDPFGGPRSIPE